MTRYNLAYCRVVGVYVEDKSVTRGKEVLVSTCGSLHMKIIVCPSLVSISKLLLTCCGRCSSSLRLVISFLHYGASRLVAVLGLGMRQLEIRGLSSIFSTSSTQSPGKHHYRSQGFLNYTPSLLSRTQECLSGGPHDWAPSQPSRHQCRPQ
jgi:hypothetical protein